VRLGTLQRRSNEDETTPKRHNENTGEQMPTRPRATTQPDHSAPPDPPIVTTSERRAFKRCPQRWWWEYREGLRNTEVAKPLWFGIGIHLALAHYYGNVGYKRNLDFVEVWDQYCDEDEISLVLKAAPDGFSEDESWVDAKMLGRSMLQGYHALYQGDPDWDVVHVEEPFEIGIPHPQEPELDVVVFNSTFDGVYRSKSRKVFNLMEHKTAKAITTDHLQMDEQGGSYWAVASIVLRHKGILTGKQVIDGIDYNFLRKGLPDERPKDAQGYATNKPQKVHYVAALQAKGIEVTDKMTLARLQEEATAAKVTVLGDRSLQQAAPLYHRETMRRTRAEQRIQIDRIAAEGVVMEDFRHGTLPLYKNVTRDCPWDCSFFNLCMLHEQDQDWREFRDAVFIKRDPYDRYRLLKSA
jgi:hypothetical protein